MSVKIEFYGENFAQAARELVGFVRAVAEDTGFATERPAAAPADAQQPDGDDEAPATAERERGKPAPGRARRTKAEIAEDEAADAAEFAPEAKKLAEEGAQQFAEDRAAMNISADPENRVDTAEAEQDAEDEAADPVNASGPEATRDDVRAEMQAYMNKFDIVRLNADMTSILKARWPDGSVTKLSEIPEDAQSFADVIAALRAKMAG